MTPIYMPTSLLSLSVSPKYLGLEARSSSNGQAGDIPTQIVRPQTPLLSNIFNKNMPSHISNNQLEDVMITPLLVPRRKIK